MLKLALSAALVVAAVSAFSPIASGRWQVSNELQESIINGRRDQISMPASKPTVVCLSANQANKGPGLAFSDPDLCQTVESSMSGTHFEYTLQCRATQSDDTIMTKATGTFTADSYTGAAVSIQRRGSTRIEMRSKVNAKRIGDC